MLDENQKGAVDSALDNTTTTAKSTETTAAPKEITSIEDWQALWDTERAAIVKNIKDNGWGWDKAGNKVTGPDGFTVDLSVCPAGEDVIGPYLTDKSGHLLDVVRPLQEKEETIHVVAEPPGELPATFFPFRSRGSLISLRLTNDCSGLAMVKIKIFAG